MTANVGIYTTTILGIRMTTNVRLLRWVKHFEGMLEEFDRLFSGNAIAVERMANLGVVSPEMAVAWGLVGPNLRASGVKYDVRKDIPYSVYSEFDFDVPVGRGIQGQTGDCYDRLWVRLQEMRESCRILKQAIEGLPEGDYMAKVPRKIKPQRDEAYAAVEAARGELGYYVVTDGKENAYRKNNEVSKCLATALLQSEICLTSKCFVMSKTF